MRLAVAIEYLFGLKINSFLCTFWLQSNTFCFNKIPLLLNNRHRYHWPVGYHGGRETIGSPPSLAGCVPRVFLGSGYDVQQQINQILAIWNNSKISSKFWNFAVMSFWEIELWLARQAWLWDSHEKGKRLRAVKLWCITWLWCITRKDALSVFLRSGLWVTTLGQNLLLTIDKALEG